MAQTPLTEEHFRNTLEGMESRILGSIRDVNTNFNKSQGLQNERMDKEFKALHEGLDEVQVKLDSLAEDMSKVKLAVVDLLATDKHMHNLVRELKLQGIALDESRIFAV